MNQATWKGGRPHAILLIIVSLALCLLLMSCGGSLGSKAASESVWTTYFVNGKEWPLLSENPHEVFKIWDELGFSYSLVRRLCSEDDLDALYKMLNNEQYVSDWPYIAQAVGMISTDTNSVPIIVDFVQRNDIANHEDVWIRDKIDALTYVGKIGGEMAYHVLKDAVTREGAVRLAQAWIDSESLKGEDWTRNDQVRFIRKAAAEGLVLLRQTRANDIIEELYVASCRSISQYAIQRKTNLNSYLVQYLAARDYIKDHSFDEYLVMRDDYEMLLSTAGLRPYMFRYWMLGKGLWYERLDIWKSEGKENSLGYRTIKKELEEAEVYRQKTRVGGVLLSQLEAEVKQSFEELSKSEL